MSHKQMVGGLVRISLGWIFLWPFVDKLLGLGFATCRDSETGAIEMMCDKAWLFGGSPTSGFLQFGTHGPLAETFQLLVGSALIDWIFMVGLLGIGLALMFGFWVRFAAWSGVAMLVLMYLAAMPPSHNPLIDDHIVYALVLIMIAVAPEMFSQFSLKIEKKK